MAVDIRRMVMAGGLLLVAAGTAGCTRTLSYTGYIPDESLIQTVAPGVDNRASVLATLGRPTFEGQFDSGDWYWVSRQSRQFAFTNPRPIAQNILHVQFDPSGDVAAVERIGLDQVVSVTPTRRVTPTLGQDRGFFQELFGNIGRVGAGGLGQAGAGSNTGIPQ